MSARVPDSVVRAGDRAAADAADRLAAAIRDQVPGVRVAREADGVAVTGRGVLSNPLLRWPAGLLR